MKDRKETGAPAEERPAEERPAETRAGNGSRAVDAEGPSDDRPADGVADRVRAPGAPAPAGAVEDACEEVAAERRDTPEEKLRALRKERDAIYERWLRAAADLENFRKRIDREREEFRRSALESIALEMVQVLDNFDRALSALPADAPAAIAAGVKLIHRQILDVMARRGLVPMETAEGAFDPHQHEAVATEVREDVPHHHVLEEVQRGYLLQGRVLRPALVKVSVRQGEEERLAGDAE